MTDLILITVVWAMGLGTGLGLGTAIASTKWQRKYYTDLFDVS